MYKEKKLQDKGVEDNVLRISTLLKAREVAEILKISRAMAYNLMLKGEIPTVRIGKCRRVRPEDLIKYIKSNTFQMNQYFE
jgi:excisionase family DNA binding protein